MECSGCGQEVRDQLRFCTFCGTPLYLFCSNCHTKVGKGDIFCGGCGIRSFSGVEFSAQQNFPQKQAKTRPNETEQLFESERKNVTVLFADISGFTSMSEKLDPEDVTNIMNDCLKRMADIVVKYEGFVDKFIGDCTMAIFGAPITHENDPELAVRAALEMVKKIEAYNNQLTIKLEKPLSVHIGINSGIVIAGGMGSDQKMDYTVMGDTVNLASRLESTAESGQIFVSIYTYNLTRNIFEYIAHEPIRVKGKKEPIPVYEVVKAKRFMDQTHKGIDTTIPIVGRTQELNTLKSCLKRFSLGQGQAVFLISTPGIGKSRIWLEIQKHFNDSEIQVIEGICQSFNKTTSYSVFTEIFKNLFNIESEDLEGFMVAKLSKTLPFLLKLNPEALSEEARKAIVFIGTIIGLKLGEQFDIPIEHMEAQEIKVSTFRAVAWFFNRIAHVKPCVLIFENLHFADNTSIEMIQHLLEALKNSPIFMLMLMRPNKEHPSYKLPLIARKTLDDYSTDITSKNLTISECGEFIQHILKTSSVPQSVLDLVWKKSDGNPLFIEEIVNHLLKSGYIETAEDGIKVIKDLHKISIPSSIHGIIISRIDKLPNDLKDILHTAAVIGPVFKYLLIKRFIKDGDIDEKLERLTAEGTIFESQSFPEIVYSFRNALIQEAVYSTLLIKKRKNLHTIIANEMETLYQDRLEDHYEVLAYHYQNSDDTHKAYHYTVKSGMKAKAAYANEDAVKCFTKAIELAKKHKSKNDELEKVYIALSDSYELMGDLDAAIEAWENALQITSDRMQRADTLRNIGRIHEKQGAKEKAIEIYDEAFQILKDYPNTVEMGMLLMNQSWVLNRMQNYDEAIEKASEALSIFDTNGVTDKIAHVCNNIAVIYEHKGDLDQAVEYNKRSLKIFKELKNMRQIANVLLSLGFIFNKRNELEISLDYFNQSLEIMYKIGNRYGAGTALMAKGRCYADLDKLEEAESVLLQALRIHTELELSRKIVANELALGKIFISMGDTTSARAHLEESKSIATTKKYTSDLAKLARLEASVLIAEGQKAEHKFREAIDLFEQIGRHREVKSIEKELSEYLETSASST